MENIIKKILLVDDEEAILFALSKLLCGKNVTVDTASTAARAYELLVAHTYDAVIADLRLAGSEQNEGFDIIQTARSTSQSRIIIVMTAYGGRDTSIKVLNAGADYYLEKPVYPQKIRALLVERGLYL